MIAESLTPQPGIREHLNPELENKIGTKRTFTDWVPMSAFGGKADMAVEGLSVP
jgi:hypothetical protein